MRVNLAEQKQNQNNSENEMRIYILEIGDWLVVARLQKGSINLNCDDNSFSQFSKAHGTFASEYVCMHTHLMHE